MQVINTWPDPDVPQNVKEALIKAMSLLSIENHPEQNEIIAHGLDCGSDP